MSGMGICRCHICNRVSSPEIATLPGDHTRVRFYEDEYGHICYYCNSVIGESLAEFEEEEEELEYDEPETWS